MHRIARLGDGWMPNHRTVEQAQSSLDNLARALNDEGRRSDQIGIEARLMYADGNPENWQRIMDEWIAAGANYFSINTMGCGFSSPDEHIKAIRHFAAAMGV
jgi:alkanesulfonate monooxygenase SsuD/methylene tetrahydromethanopterin reductase-like flavin-dependent oxidoreductase (luciferase family)